MSDFVSRGVSDRLETSCRRRLAAAALQRIGPNPTRADMLRVINEVGSFDISGSIITAGAKAHEAPSKVFLTVIQADGTFKAVDKL